MQKNIMIPTLLAIITLAVFGIYTVFSYGKKAEPEKMQKNDVPSQEKGIMEPQPAVNGDSTVMNQSEIDTPETAAEYVLSTAEAKYSVMKTYFGKPAVEVIGMTSLINGTGWFDEQSKKAAVLVNLKFDTVKSDSSKRDQDIAPLFSTPDIVLKGEFADLPSLSNQATEITAAVSLTINAVTKEVPMTLSVLKTADGAIQAEGNGQIKMSDFNVKAPSLINVFSVTDEVKLSFTMTAIQKKSPENSEILPTQTE